jgi:citrate lyase subunit beta/citryl-CoA lyase
MMVNPLNSKHLDRLDISDADMITLNLEDAIAPSKKREALENIGNFLSNSKDIKSSIIVRVNPLNKGGDFEIDYLNKFKFDAIRLSKVKSQTHIEDALKIINIDKELHISLETKEAFNNLTNLKIDSRLTTASLGILDLLTSLHLPQSLINRPNPTIDYILSKFLVDSKIAGVLPISFMYQDYKNIDGFREWCIKEKSMGFTTKACMGPAQVKVANQIFGFSKTDIVKAKEIKRLFELNSANGINGFMDNRYGFIDEPIYKDALLVTSKANILLI